MIDNAWAVLTSGDKALRADASLLDKLLLVNPHFALVTQLSELGEDNLLMREHHRPAWYSATTRVHMGRGGLSDQSESDSKYQGYSRLHGTICTYCIYHKFNCLDKVLNILQYN